MRRKILSIILVCAMLTSMQSVAVLANSADSIIEATDDTVSENEVSDGNEGLSGEDIDLNHGALSGMFSNNHVRWNLKKTSDLSGFILTINPCYPNSQLCFSSVNGSVPWPDYKDYIVSVVIENDPSYGESGASIDKIDNSFFDRHTKLKTVSLPDTVTEIGDYSFSFCNSLETINLPEGLVSVGKSAFVECSSLSELELPSTLTTISELAFCDTTLQNLHIPASVTSIGEGAFATRGTDSFRSLESITVDSKNNYYTAVDNVLFTKDKKTIIQCAEMKTGDYVVPNGVETISPYAFGYCTGIDNITFPTTLKTVDDYAFYYGLNSSSHAEFREGLTSIGERAFFHSHLKSISLPNSLQEIGVAAFYSTGLKEIEIPEGVETIPSDCFWCSNLKSVTIPGNISTIQEQAFSACHNLKTVVIEAGTTAISDEAFLNCDNLSEITIPGTLKSLGNKVFSGCSSLATVHYKGTKEAWIALLQAPLGIDELVNANVLFEPDILSGSLYLTNYGCYGNTVSYSLSDNLKALNSAGCLTLTWKYKKDGEFYPVTEVNNFGKVETNGYLTIGKGLIGKTIRLEATSAGLLGEVVSAEKTVEKANAKTPSFVSVAYDSSSNSIVATVDSEDLENQEYLLLPDSTALDTALWNKAVSGTEAVGEKIIFSTDSNNNALIADSNYILYYRIAENDCYNSSLVVLKRTVFTGSVVALEEHSLILDGIASNDSTKKIYIDITKVGADSTVTLPITNNTVNVNKWDSHTWSSSSTSVASISKVGESAATDLAYTASGGTYPGSIKLTIAGTGYTTIKASHDSYPAKTFGTWQVQVYNPNTVSIGDVNAMLDGGPYKPSSAVIKLGDTYIPDGADRLTLAPVPENNTRFELRWYEGYYKKNLYGSSYYIDKNNEYDFIEVDSSTGVVTAKNVTAANPSAEGDYAYVLLYIHDNSNDTEKQAAYYPVQVTDIPVSAVTKVTLNQTSSNLYIGDVLKLVAAISPSYVKDAAVTWASSDDTVASVNSTGTVTALSEGTATISATVGGKSAECNITVKKDLSSLWIKPIPDQAYTGKLVKPSVEIYLGKNKLTLGTDYTVSYKNNKKEGNPASVNSKGKSIAPTVIIKGKGNFTGTRNVTFTISKDISVTPVKANLAEINPDIRVAEAVFRNAKVKPAVTVTFGEYELVCGVDYTVTYKNNKAVGAPGAVNSRGKNIAPTVCIKGKGNFSGAVSKEFYIDKSSNVVCTVNYKGTVKVYDTLTGKVVPSKNYVTDKTSVPGSVEVSCKPESSYSFSPLTLKVPKKAVVKASMVDSKAVHTYSGKPVTLDKSEIKVSVNNETISETDFEIVAYLKNDNAGKAAAIIQTSDGAFAICKFKISPMTFSR